MKYISILSLVLLLSCRKVKEDVYVVDTVTQLSNGLYVLDIKNYDYNIATKDSVYRVGDTLIFRKK